MKGNGGKSFQGKVRTELFGSSIPVMCVGVHSQKPHIRFVNSGEDNTAGLFHLRGLGGLRHEGLKKNSSPLKVGLPLEILY